MGNKILLIDDSVTVQKIISLTFSDEGVEVVAVDSGDEAINRLSYLRPALVMADVSIPGRNGYDICAYIKNSPELRHIPVILLVPGFETYDVERGRRVGADHHLTTPFQSIRSLIATVKSLISGGQPVATASLVAPEVAAPPVALPDVPEVEDSPADLEASLPVAPSVPSAFGRPGARLTVMPEVMPAASEAVAAAGAAHPAPHWSPEIIDLLVGRITEQVAQQVTQQVTQQVVRQLAGHLEAEINRGLAAMNAELPARIAAAVAAQLTLDVPPPRYDDPDQLLELDDF